MHPRALHSQECFLPRRGDHNLRCTRERYIPKNVFFLREEVLIYDAPMHPVYHAKITVSTKNFLLDQWHGLMVARMSSSSAGGESATYFTEPPDFHISPRALHSQECFLPLRGGFNLRCTRERYIPKNVFFLRRHGYTDKGKGRKRD